ncbi:hypothetical protein GV64_19970 [Endozoicomonas elysicola]|uniref:Alpha/beta hydrolase fold-3 domain-containing protein n=2 Tax=Endozoicomonas elysicola TaxID=305900 RepID=A0A081KEX2_9GAMM|nr:hypothetical protein GV64_19970 [Endozoicomonas elysicola]
MIAERTVPVPEDISIGLRDYITSNLQPDVKAASQFKPESGAEWKEKKNSVNSKRIVKTQELMKQLPVNITLSKINGVTVRYVTPHDVDERHKDHLFVDIHGGAFLLNEGDGSIQESMYIATRLKIPVVSIDYRTLPEHPFPAPLDDVVIVYQGLLRERHAKSMILGGTSAGGNLALASLLKFRELGIAFPGALYLGTPWSDLTKTGDTQYTNEGLDRLLVGNEGLLSQSAALYAGNHDLLMPLISPVYGQYGSFPPTYLVTGTRDLLLSDTVRVHRKLRQASVVAELNVYEGMSHADYLYAADTPESRQVYAELNDFLLRHMH